MTETYLTAKTYLAMITQGAAKLNANRKVINDLNVFPIPDGDTGDNMYMTISSGCQSGKNCKNTDNISEMASCIASGMLLGARGNSGVILSRIFSGISKGLKGLEKADLHAFMEAMDSGVKEAYSSVMTPVEGTILTVLRESVENAEGNDFESYFASLLKEMKTSLEHTPDKLAVLKDAGVVDSGGAGMLCVAEGMAEGLQGIQSENTDDGNETGFHAQVNLDDFGPDTPFEFGYCTEFLLRLRSDKVADIDNFDESAIRDYLCSVGESVVFFRDGSVIKVHVHTGTPGEILSKMQTWGEFLTVKIENMTLQHSEVHIKDDFSEKNRVLRKKIKYGAVAVASGAGLANAFKEAGVDEVIEGGQTMNPSTGSFIEAFERMDAGTIFVFPNNSNIILTAKQAASIYKKAEVIVVPTKDIGSGYVAAASMDRSMETSDKLFEAIMETVNTVRTGMISRANRNILKNGVIVRDGDFIGFCAGEILCDDADRTTAATMLCSKIGMGDHEVAIVFCGSEVDSDEASKLCSTLQASYPYTEIINTAGGQPVFDYIITLC